MRSAVFLREKLLNGGILKGKDARHSHKVNLTRKSYLTDLTPTCDKWGNTTHDTGHQEGWKSHTHELHMCLRDSSSV